MLKETLWKIATLDFLRGGGSGSGEGSSSPPPQQHSDVDVNEEPMGDSCSKVAQPMLEEGGGKQGTTSGNHDGDDDSNNSNNSNNNNNKPTVARLPPVPSSPSTATNAGSKRTREGGKLSSFRRSIFRVGSRTLSGSNNSGTKDMNGVPHSPRARASTYSHVHDAVMYNLSEAETSKHDQTVPMGVIGMRNLGNTCFMNSSLQCLSATIPLTDYFLGYDYRSEINKDNFLGTGGKLVTAYAELMKQMWLGSKSVVEPSNFKKQISTFAPQFSGYHQHDAQELLAFLLDGIHEDLNRVKERPYIEDRDCDGTNDEEDAIENWKNYLRRNKSLIVDMFQGQLRNTCKCLQCGHVNVRFEPFMYLSLPMSKTTKSLDDCIDLYLKEESLSGDNKYNCEKCKTLTNGTKKQDLWMLPPVLIVHLKRFKYNDYGKIGTKNDAAIDYPVTEWDLKSRVKSSRGVYPRYDLYAVANHMGGLGGGHYTAHALNRFDDTWYEFNDSSYRSVDESIHESLSKSAYVLFYNRSEGDASMPLNERSPMIRRQSVSRPDLWPHSQVDDPRQVRNFARASRRHLDQLQPPTLQPPEIPMRWHDASESATSTGVEMLTSITEGSGRFPSSGSLDVKESPKPPPKIHQQRSPPQKLPDPPSSQDLKGSTDNSNATPKRTQQSLQRKEKFEKPNKPRRKTRSTKPTQV